MATQEPQTHVVPATLPIPPDFLVTWEQPGDAEVFWTLGVFACATRSRFQRVSGSYRFRPVFKPVPNPKCVAGNGGV